jgi:hypothetical protein
VQPLISLLPPPARFRWRRRLEAWRYGSGADHHHPAPPP